MLARNISMKGLMFLLVLAAIAIVGENHLVVLIQKTFKINKKPANIVALLIMVLIARWLVLAIGVPVLDYIEELTGWTFR